MLTSGKQSFIGLLCALTLGGALPAQAADYPTKPIRLIVPFASGGSVEAFARQISVKLSLRLGQPIIIEPKPGAGGAIGTEFVMRAEPDGYTFLLHSGSIITDPLMRKKPTYDVRKDLTPVIMAATAGLAVASSNAMPFTSMAGLIDYARQNPGKLNYGTPGIGSSVHLLTEMFNSLAGVKIVHVPYKGGGPAMTALMANEVQVLFTPLVTAKPQALTGRIRPLAVTTGKRSNAWPELPTINEARVIDYDFGVWYAFFAPPKTPPALLNQMNREIAAVLQDPEVSAWLTQNGLDPVPNSSEEFRVMLNREVDRWASMLKTTAISVD